MGPPNVTEQRSIPKGMNASLAWWLSFMLIFWAPFYGEQRIPSFLLLLFGLALHLTHRDLIRTLPGARELGMIFLPLLCSLLITTPFSLDIGGSLSIVAALVLYFWVGLAILTGLAHRPPVYLSIGIGLVLALWAVDGLFQRFHGVDIFGYGLGVDGRIYGPFGDNQRLGYIMGVMLPVVLWPWTRSHPRTVIAAFLLAIFVISLGGSRSSLVFAILAGIGLFLRLTTWPQRITLTVLAPLVLATSTMMSPPLKERILERGYTPLTTSQVRQQDGSGVSNSTAWNEDAFRKIDLFLSYRLTIWETAWHMLRDRPWVGVGPGAFDDMYKTYANRPDDPFRSSNRDVHHAHQLYISVLAETGITGFIGLMISIGLGYRWYRRLPKMQKEEASPFAHALFIALFPLNSQHGLFIGWWFPTLLLLLCAMLAAGRRTPPIP